MLEEPAGIARTDSGRPIADELLLRIPFVVDLLLALVARLPPGSPLRRRFILWGLKRGLDAAVRKDYDFQRLGYEPDVEIFLSGPAGVGFEASYRGHQGLRESTIDFFENFAETRVTVKRVLDARDRWVAEMETLGQGKESAVPFATNWGTVFYVSARGKIRRQDILWAEDGWSQALEAAGLSE